VDEKEPRLARRPLDVRVRRRIADRRHRTCNPSIAPHDARAAAIIAPAAFDATRAGAIGASRRFSPA